MKLLRWAVGGASAYVIYKYSMGRKAKGEDVFATPEKAVGEPVPARKTAPQDTAPKASPDRKPAARKTAAKKPAAAKAAKTTAAASAADKPKRKPAPRKKPEAK